jgi:microcystin-dependent protein
VSNTELQIRSSPGSRLGAQDDRPLNDQEYQLVQRLFGDPLSFPLAFKSWLVGYLETSDMSLPMSSVMGLQSTLGITSAGQGTLGILPAGLIFPYGGGTAPTGALMCDGASYAKSLQPRLFAAIGFNYGGNGVDQFNVPDIRERIPVGKGSMAAHDTLGKNEGAALGQRGTAHHHPSLPVNMDGSVSGSNILVGTDHAPNSSQPVGPAGTPQDTPAFITINFIIVA